MISDAHEGIKAAVAKVFNASWQRCTIHFMRNVAAHTGRKGKRVVAALIATAFAQPDAKAAKTQFRAVADQIRPKVPKLAELMDHAETDVLAYMDYNSTGSNCTLIQPHRAAHQKIKRRTDVVVHLPQRAGHSPSRRCYLA